MSDEIPPYRWFIGLLGDGTYRFITPDAFVGAEKFIGKNGGAIYTHAGYLIFAANKSWYNWLTKEYNKKYKMTVITQRPPHIDVPNIDCAFSPEALKWLEENEELLKQKGNGFYANLPRIPDA